ncbi:MAG TPA: non-ribosomal peptide synthetase [Candidatus Acidoferrales bacterium]|nr:non-ribosomal peptide synthetase [Candidatus Acidoferrales bacterium]
MTGFAAKAIHQVFEEQAAAYPGRAALLFGDETLSYGQLNERANQLASYLRKLDVGRETMVGICLNRSLDLVIGILGVLKAGAAYVPLDPSYPGERLAYMVEDTASPVIVASAATAGRVAALAPRTRSVHLDGERQAIAAEPAGNVEVGLDGEDLAYVMYTSGSTGRPKGVMVPHRAVVRLVRDTNYCRFGPDEVILQAAPFSFDASTFEIWGALLNGGRLAIMQPEAISLEGLERAIDRFGVTTLWLTAGLFHLMVEQRSAALRSLRQLLAGGDVLSPRHVRLALGNMPHGRVINGYGPTEGTTFTCCHTMTAANPPGDSVPIGKPICRTTVYVLDSGMAPVPAGEAGELYIGGDGLARGYLNDPELTAAKFIVNPEHPGEILYRTGDRVRYLPDGNLDFLGRTDHQVKIAGHRIELQEVEAAVECYPGVRRAAVLVREDTGRDKRLVAYVLFATPGKGEGVLLREFLATKLPPYMVPSAIVMVEEMPLSCNGKVDRNALSALEIQETKLEEKIRPMNSAAELTILEIWKRVLNSGDIGRDDNFFDIGGDSLHLIAVHADLQKVFGRELSITDLFEHTTVRSLARRIDQAQTPSETFDAAATRAARQKEARARQRQAKAVRPA